MINHQDGVVLGLARLRVRPNFNLGPFLVSGRAICHLDGAIMQNVFPPTLVTFSDMDWFAGALLAAFQSSKHRWGGVG